MRVPSGYTYISAAQRMGWDLAAGHPFPMVTAEGARGSLPLSTARMTTTLRGHLRAAGLPSHFTMHSFHVRGSFSKSLAGTAVDEIMKIGGWQTVAKYYYTSGPPLAKKCTVARRNVARVTLALTSYHCRLSFKNISQRVGERIDQMLRKVWVRQPRA